MAVACDWCGTTADELPLTWVTSVEGGALRRYCEQCARKNLRSIEGKLDSPDW